MKCETLELLVLHDSLLMILESLILHMEASVDTIVNVTQAVSLFTTTADCGR